MSALHKDKVLSPHPMVMLIQSLEIQTHTLDGCLNTYAQWQY